MKAGGEELALRVVWYTLRGHVGAGASWWREPPSREGCLGSQAIMNILTGAGQGDPGAHSCM